MNNQFFQTLITKRGRFLNGENPSPAKLSAINAQNEAAFAVIESFLGNGTDYLVDSDPSRKLLPNLSNAIGSGEKIYKPVNFFHSLEQVAKKYLGDITKYNSGTGVLTLAGPTTSVTVHIPQGNIVGIYYKTAGNNTVTITYNSTDAVFPASTANYTWALIPATGASAESFTISCNSSLSIKSMVLSNTSSSDVVPPIQANVSSSLISATQVVANVAYSVPPSNNVYFSVKTPCFYASSLRQGTVGDPGCQHKTCDYCIGNTYSLSTPGASGFGSPLCSGALLTTGGAASYQPDNTTTNKTFQSPLLTADNPYSAKYMPFRIYSGISAGVKLPSNSVFLYDIGQNIPIIQNVNFYSASQDRGDILFVKDQLDILNSNKKYLVVGGSYGISNLLWDILGLTKGY